MTPITSRMIHPTVIKREWAMDRVPFGLIPVNAAKATMTTTIPSNAIQFIIRHSSKREWR